MYPLRIAGFDYQGLHRYFLTLCAFRRSPVFCSSHVVTPVLSQFRQAASREPYALLAYCFMPDHVHMLLEARGEFADFRRFVTTAKQKAGYWYSQETGQRLWQLGFYDHVLRDDERTLAVACYILANSVRAGLVRAIEAYPFAGSDVFAIDEIAAAVQAWTPPGRPVRQA